MKYVYEKSPIDFSCPRKMYHRIGLKPKSILKRIYYRLKGYKLVDKKPKQRLYFSDPNPKQK